ncbi:L-2-hydroxyglutarate oxidase [uncultured Nitrosomonas sp.]|uniref:L-2-hydroxyglutarate oxidase n=1 Tax=uncultured Nitrosomonas sp. TaxID=156424 RepID=UPI0025FE9C36|nr:L-2-hydroxyglutarate oxidase [uncultured Nitrosomonas sp.]
MKYDIAIVGAGIVGLATGLQVLKKSPDLKICFIEKESTIAQHQTGHNSGVIHSGIYYKPGSLKALNCKRGYDLMLEFVRAYDIPYELCGKIIVATEEKELLGLDDIYKRGIENGLKDLELLSSQEIKGIEPYVSGIKAIRVPQTGITDYKLVARKYKELLDTRGVDFFFEHKVIDLDNGDRSVTIRTNKGEFQSDKVINCGGLYSDKLARITVDDLEYKIVPFRGEYYHLKPNANHLIKGLIYPVPDPSFPFLGVHFTKTIQGGVKCGPNAVFALGREGYQKSNINVSELFESLTYSGFLSLAMKHWKAGCMEMHRSFSRKAYVESLQKLIPSITGDDVLPGLTGVRAQAIKKDGSMVDDFLILHNKRIINICNAPSPAATASLAIGEHVASII